MDNSSHSVNEVASLIEADVEGATTLFKISEVEKNLVPKEGKEVPIQNISYTCNENSISNKKRKGSCIIKT